MAEGDSNLLRHPFDIMTLQDKLLEDTKDAMRTGDKVRRSVLSFLRSAIHYEEIRKQAQLSDEEVLEVIARQVKQRKESITDFRKGKRLDLVEEEEAELTILQEYMPEQMSQEQIEEIALEVIRETGARGPSDKGRVMGRIMPQVKGKADGSEVNAVVTRLLEEDR